MTVLYSNGCSYTANYWVDDNDRYPALIGNHFGWDVHDCAIPGSCNTRIIRCTMRDCIKLLEQNEKIVALVQLTHVHRIEYAGTPIDGVTKWRYADGDHFESIKPGDTNDLPSDAKHWATLSFALYKEPAEITRLLSEIVGLISFFKQHNISYLVFSGPQFPAFTADPFSSYLLADKNILNFTDFSMLGLTGKAEHPDSAGMKIIAEYFIGKLANLAN